MGNTLNETKDKIKKKALEKMGEKFSHPDFAVADSSVVEQASSFPTAQYLSSLVPETKVLADLTAGLGVNSLFFSLNAGMVYSIECDRHRAEAFADNVKKLGIDNVEVINEDCIKWLESTNLNPDIVFVDPARRNVNHDRFYSLEQSSPDVREIIPLIKTRSKRLLVKASPLLDLSAAARTLPGVTGFHILEFNREVKELIIDMNPSDESFAEDYFIQCVRLKKDSEPEIIEFNCKVADGKETEGLFIGSEDELGEYRFILEPSPSIMKSGCFSLLAERFPGIKLMSPNTHLFLSKELYRDFPGRKFEITGAVNSGDLKKMKGEKYNVISRNHPAKASDIVSRYRLQPSEDRFLIACKLGNDKKIYSAERR